ncbi:MAG: gamma carbonic anhydrase family protein [Proteobacteria bacterium]|nr:gamma carbonic anhydrase family protein [Pseudomonadota bacterium]
MPIFSLGERRVELRGERHYIAHDATLAGSILLENDVSIWFGVIIRADNDQVTIGAETNVQDGSVLHVDPGFPLALGRNVTIGHKAMLHGCSVGDGTLIGINSVILNGAKIGAGTLVGANSLVSEGKEIPPGVLVLGSPAKVVRELTPEEKARLMETSHGYVARARVFRASLREQELPASARPL